MIKRFFTAVLVVGMLIACNSKKPNEVSVVEKQDNSLYLIVGTYTQKDSKGIYVYEFDTITGASTYVSNVAVENPSYLAVSSDSRFVYAVSENDEKTSALNAFSFNRIKGELTPINSHLTGGGSPCYVAIADSSNHILTANYGGGNLTVFTTNTDGSLNIPTQLMSFTGKGLDPKRQAQPHIHCVAFSPDDKYVYATDLGTDKIHKFNVNGEEDKSFMSLGTPLDFNVAAGEGPRHLTFHPNGKYAYLITEIGGSVIAFNYRDGNLSEFQSVKADELGAKGSADIHISPNGKFLYASNRLKGDGIAIFSIDDKNGRLQKVGYQETGIHPRNFIITNNGKFLLSANRDSDNIQVFQIDEETGLLTDMKLDIKLSMPVCLKFAEKG